MTTTDPAESLFQLKVSRTASCFVGRDCYRALQQLCARHSLTWLVHGKVAAATGEEGK
jgi:hypothetical protein